jgi:putative phosphoesterase
MRLRRVGLVGDIHAEDVKLEAALRHLEAEAVEAILSVGDVVDGPGDPDRCCELLERHGVLAVRGNHDRWLLAGEMRELPRAHLREDLDPRSIERLATLPASQRLDTEAGALLLCHGLDDDDMARLLPWDEGYALESNDSLQRLVASGAFSVVAGGHTHRRMVRNVGGMVFVNAGTLLTEAEPCFALLDFGKRKVQFHELLPDGGSKPGESLSF